MEVLWQNVLVENPFFKKDKSPIHVEGNVKEEMMMKEIEKCKKLPIHKAGHLCTKVKEGQNVYIDTQRLMSSPRVTLDGNKDYFIVRETDIVFVYE
jgi:hypothetical protein